MLISQPLPSTPSYSPREDVTSLIISHCHDSVEHQGRGMTHNRVRSFGFWINGASSAISDFIAKCVCCRKLRGAVQEQKMADLLEDRVQPAPPFTYCAVDYLGPWYVKEGRRQLKRYGVLFTCMASRAVHLHDSRLLSQRPSLLCRALWSSLPDPLRLRN